MEIGGRIGKNLLIDQHNHMLAMNSDLLTLKYMKRNVIMTIFSFTGLFVQRVIYHRIDDALHSGT